MRNIKYFLFTTALVLAFCVSDAAEAKRSQRRILKQSVPNTIDSEAAPQILEFSSLEPEGLLVDQESERLGQEEEAHRHEMILDADCPLVLFFSHDYGGEAVKGQMQGVPAKCRHNYHEWKNSVANIQQAKLIHPAEKKELDKDEEYDDTNNGRVRIDADGLAWYYEREPEREETAPYTYVVLDNRGERYELTDLEKKAEVKKIPARWKQSLLPQYSNMDSLRRYKSSVGRSLASELPIIDAPNADGPVPPAPKPTEEK